MQEHLKKAFKYPNEEGKEGALYGRPDLFKRTSSSVVGEKGGWRWG